MAHNKVSALSDLLGVLRGVYIIHSHAAQIPRQRTITLQRALTKNQTDEIRAERLESTSLLAEEAYFQEDK